MIGNSGGILLPKFVSLACGTTGVPDNPRGSSEARRTRIARSRTGQLRGRNLLAVNWLGSMVSLNDRRVTPSVAAERLRSDPEMSLNTDGTALPLHRPPAPTLETPWQEQSRTITARSPRSPG